VKVLFLTRYTARGASSRYRTHQYLPHLEARGIECDASALLGDAYLDARFRRRRRPLGALLRAFLRRVGVLLRSLSYDLVVVEKELFPYAPAFLERLLLRLPRRYSLDFDDALFHVYDEHTSAWVRRALGGKFASLLRRARHATVGNPYLAGYCERHGSRVIQVPTVLDLARYRVLPEPEGAFTVGWIGTPLSAHNLARAAEGLRAFFARHDGRLLLIGAGAGVELPGVPVEVVPWSEDGEAELLSSIHVGIMPLWDEPFERGKSGLKLLQYLACGRPVVASPVGVNVDVVTPDVGYLAEDPDEWLRHLETLRKDEALRGTLGRRGREKVEDGYSLAVWAERYAEILEAAALR